MYIKSVKIQGFKSFADKIELDLNPGINAVVGPNGSGKSNVVDALLWVLGEQSVKQLRGDGAMCDVIFSGSKNREELKKASVAILFDNTDKRLNTEYNEVEIKRVIYSSGENEYYINNAKVRLKDITDLLIDVTSKFNIISQGNINALVENKSSERRILFESAAGVLKYKKRKEEALKKLDGTKENLTRINLIIKELLTTLKPLEKQKDDAEKYLEIKNNLEGLEIALIADDITEYNNKYSILKDENSVNQKRLDELSLTENTELEKLKLESIKLDENIQKSNTNILKLSEEISKLNSEKQINLERLKYKLDSKTINENLLQYNETKLSLERIIEINKKEIEDIQKKLNQTIKDYNLKTDDELKTKIELSSLNNEYNKLNIQCINLENKIKIEKSNIENNAFVPKSVNSILTNPRLDGIHNTIGNLIDINDAHKLAIETALSSSINVLVVDDMLSAKKAINYLKENSLGRATFFPIDTIKSRKIAKDIENSLQEYSGYIGIASDLVQYDSKYKDIIENQLGNVLVVDTIDDLFKISKDFGYKYKMVSLDGEIVYPGGSVSGGINNAFKSDKKTLNLLVKELDSKKRELENINNTIKKTNSKYDLLGNSNKKLAMEITENRILLDNKNKFLEEKNNEYSTVLSNIQGLNDKSNNNLDTTINELLEKTNKKLTEKELEENNLKNYQSNKFDITNKISELEKEIALQNATYHKLENTIKNNEIEIGKYEVKIDNLLQILSEEYNISYEYAHDNYSLDIDNTLAREAVNKYRSELKKLNNINIGSIAEYDRLKKRYDFLDKQKNDLEESSNELLKIINEMDDIMKDKFKETFNKISMEFTKIFRQMFKGGNGILKLTDENDLLNTGINILAVPPGKKLNSTAALSGGEKALTAICLIFAILNVKPVPFIVLDEAEAALDEENVNMFGEYLSEMKKQSQFIIITHKKRMMEYADILYGITMQESGVSKLVSVKIEN